MSPLALNCSRTLSCSWCAALEKFLFVSTFLAEGWTGTDADVVCPNAGMNMSRARLTVDFPPFPFFRRAAARVAAVFVCWMAGMVINFVVCFGFGFVGCLVFDWQFLKFVRLVPQEERSAKFRKLVRDVSQSFQEKQRSRRAKGFAFYHENVWRNDRVVPIEPNGNLGSKRIGPNHRRSRNCKC